MSVDKSHSKHPVMEHVLLLNLVIVFFFLDLNTPICAEHPYHEPGLIFYLSGENGMTADYAQGEPSPSHLNDISIIPDGAHGQAFKCPNYTQVMAYNGSGNIYAERGTLSFFWRPREPLGQTPFHIFMVSYNDHTSIDMAFLRIDYNGHGYDAYVTDANLGRVRISYTEQVLPKPDQWVHLVLAWDENRGSRFYVDGAIISKKDTTAVFYAGLDLFGPFSHYISPQYVRNELCWTRGGDIDELRIYDQMLSQEHITRLAKGDSAGDITPEVRTLNQQIYRNEWWLRYGWNRPGDIPPALESSSTCVRKVEIHTVYDLKQWVWKGNDGIRETTWPYVYNRSRLLGRKDYFTEPDWNCYSGSGKTVTFFMPDEKWNHLEISGAAFGSFTDLYFNKEQQKDTEKHLFDRPSDQERTFHRFPEPFLGGKVRFVNERQETPIGEFEAYFVSPGQVPEGTCTLTYTLTARAEPDNPSLDTLVKYINGRFMSDERQVVVALPGGAPRTPKITRTENALPLIHILVPSDFRNIRPSWSLAEYSYTWENMYNGLDGIAIDLPPLNVKPTHGEYFPMNIQVKDPIWPDRNLLNFSFSVKPGEAKQLWLDTRDRILPNGYPLYVTIAGAGQDFSAYSLEGARLHLIFKDRKQALPEHEVDRITQVVDNWGNISECGPNSKKLKMYDRFIRDVTDLLRVNPDNLEGRYYWSIRNPEQGWPLFEQLKTPSDVPLWAFRQIEYLKLVKEFIMWWIDERQIENGQFGGGLSDDGDMTNQWPGLALMGVEPEKITDSVNREMEAFYENNMLTNGLPTNRMDELHVYEEGLNVIPQTMLLDYGNPKVVERLMKTAKAYELITDINNRGERQLSTGFFSGTEFSKEGVWGVAKTLYSYLIFHDGLVLVEYNGHPAAKKLLLEVADGFLAHRKKDPNGQYYLPAMIDYPGGEDSGRGSLGYAISLFWAAYRWTGDSKYLLPILDEIHGSNYDVFYRVNNNFIDILGKRDTWGKDIVSHLTPQRGSDLMRHVAWQVTGNTQFLEEYYADLIQTASQRMHMYTEDHWWVDRVNLDTTCLQRSRLGGIALIRSSLYPGHAVSWEFEAPATGESVAILIPDATPTNMTILVYNIENAPVTAHMTAWDIEPGEWDVVEGIDTDGDNKPNTITRKQTIDLERTEKLEITFPPKITSIIQLKLKSKALPYWNRPDLGIGIDDITVQGNSVRVMVHSLGSVDAPVSTIALLDASGKVISTTPVPALKAPLDYIPKTVEITLSAPAGTNLSGCIVCIDPQRKMNEIMKQNNAVKIP